MDSMINKLKNPPKEYRSLPFWSWNDKLEPEMLKWQIREMEKAGLGGYFMHARGGLQTEYLSEEWMQCIATCIEEGNKLGLNSWCYDEEGWPSGFAGGIITALGDAYHVRWLEIEEADQIPCLDNRVLGVYIYDKKSNTLERVPGATPEKPAGEDRKLWVVKHRSNPYYIDILNEKVVKAFIDSTYEKYYDSFKDHFGKGMPGFFTDEPQFSRGKIPWSYGLPDAFRERFGYDLLQVLPALFIECSGYEKVRYDFWSLVNELYVTSFGKQIYDWCEEHHCQFTGHVMLEDGLHSQMSATAGVMPFYEHMHIPGMDWLGRKIGSPIVPKQVSSIADQLGRKFAVSETFALCGWDVSFEELKWIAEWQYVNGISLMCQHLEGYTLRGLRKRDYPPSLFFQQSWWDEYRQFNDYFARLGMLLTEGSSAMEVLLLHPMKSGWITYNGSNTEALEKLDRDFIHAAELLSALHIGHHYGDESILRKHGSTAGGRFIVGKCFYRVVVLPSLVSLDPSTLELLHQFIEGGGTVISIGDFPIYCGGTANAALQALKDKVLHIHSQELLYQQLVQLQVPTIRIAEGGTEIGRVHCLQRNLGNTRIFFMVNLDQEQSYQAQVTLKGNGAVRRFDAEKAEAMDVNCTSKAGETHFSLTFLPMQSHVILFTLEENATSQALSPSKEVRIRPGQEWNIDAIDLNSLTLDYCCCRIDDGEWSEPIHTIRLMDLLLNRKKECDVSLRFSFEVEMDLENNREFYLVLETASEFEITVNGSRIAYQDIGWWKDSSFKKVDIKSHVQLGKNEVLLKRRFYQSQKVYDVLFGKNVLETEKNKLTYDVELESIYIVGDFGVVSRSGYSSGERKAVFTDGPFVITDQPQQVLRGDLTPQGFCFFAGSVKLSQNLSITSEPGTRLLLDLGKPKAAMSKVFVNDAPAGNVLWAPYTVDITDFVQAGENKITVQLFSGNRNLLGPHHHISGESYSVGPSTFTDKPGWTERGMTAKEIWRDRYCFVQFGLDS